jgi:hypothetical protein
VSSTACMFPAFAVDQRPEEGDGGGQGVGATGGSVGSTSGASAEAGGGAGSGVSGGSVGGGGSGGSAAQAGAAGMGNAGAGGQRAVVWSEGELEELGFELLGVATVDAAGVVLVGAKEQRGAIVQTQPLDLEASDALHLEVGIRILSDDIPADGLALVIHASPNGPSTLGLGGGGLGYGGLVPCLAVELDLFQTATDPSVPHLTLMPDCNPENHGPSSSAVDGNVADGKDWTLTMDWSSSTNVLEVHLRSVETGHDAELLHTVDLSSVIGPEAFLAVTAATGGHYATQRLTSLRLEGAGLSWRGLVTDSQ